MTRFVNRSTSAYGSVVREKGWVMVGRDDGHIFDFTFSYRRRDAIKKMADMWVWLTPRQLRARWKACKCQITIGVSHDELP